MKERQTIWVQDDPYGSGAFHASTVIEEQHETRSKLLGPDGRPLKYEQKQPLGFDLRSNK